MPKKPLEAIEEHFSKVTDPRKDRTKDHKLLDIIAIAICGVICGAEGWVDIENFGKSKEGWLRTFLELPNGIPSHDTFGRVFSMIDAQQFQLAFWEWVCAVNELIQGQVINIDGKCLRGSDDETLGKRAIYMVSAWAADNEIVLGQRKVDEKSNEITAIPELLDALYIKGFLVSIDAMGCQKAIARQIVGKQADYLLTVKGNQPGVLQAIQDAFADQQDAVMHIADLDTGHGRIVAQRCSVLPATGIVPEADWPGCAVIGRIDSLRQVKGKTSELEQRYYISSRNLAPAELAPAVRAHWAIENQLHWVMDVTMREDASTIRKDHAPENLSLLKKIVLNILRTDTSGRKKLSLRIRRKRAAWDDDLRAQLLGLNPL